MDSKIKHKNIWWTKIEKKNNQSLDTKDKITYLIGTKKLFEPIIHVCLT